MALKFNNKSARGSIPMSDAESLNVDAFPPKDAKRYSTFPQPEAPLRLSQFPHLQKALGYAIIKTATNNRICNTLILILVLNG